MGRTVVHCLAYDSFVLIARLERLDEGLQELGEFWGQGGGDGGKGAGGELVEEGGEVGEGGWELGELGQGVLLGGAEFFVGETGAGAGEDQCLARLQQLGGQSAPTAGAAFEFREHVVAFHGPLGGGCGVAFRLGDF